MDLKALALPIFALLILTEVVITVVRGRNAYAWQDFGGSMSQRCMNVLVKLSFDIFVVALYFLLYQYRLFDIPNGPLQWVFTLLVLDFMFYWYHRASHRVRFLWCAHVVHHSSERMNFGTALRQYPTGPLTIVLF